MPSKKQSMQQATKPSRKINLIRKRLSAMGRANHAWYICKCNKSVAYYLADFDDEHNTAMWCKRKEDATKFHSETSVYQFLTTWLAGRKDLTILQSVSD